MARRLILIISVILLVVLPVFLVSCSDPSSYDDGLTDEERSKQYDEMIQASALENNIESELIKAVIWKESRFKHWQRGSKGEYGLMQLMPFTADDWAKSTGEKAPSGSELLDPRLNIVIGSWYLGWCAQRFPERRGEEGIILQLAAYNAGVKNTREWLSKCGKRTFTLEKVGFPSTRSYIKQILEKRNEYRSKAE